MQKKKKGLENLLERYNSQETPSSEPSRKKDRVRGLRPGLCGIRELVTNNLLPYFDYSLLVNVSVEWTPVREIL